MSYLNNIKDPPEWMNSDFYRTVLRSSENDNSIEIVRYECKPAAKFGEHFASVIRRSFITYRCDHHNDVLRKTLIVKTVMPGEANSAFNDRLKNSPAFATEVRMYTKTLPKMQQLLRRAGYDNEITAPKILYYSTEPNQVIVLEDICERGYHTLPGTLDFANATKAAAKLARFHAASYHLYYDLEDNNIADYKDGLLSSESLGVADMFNDAIERFIKETTSWPGQSHYRERLNKFQATIFQKCRSVYNCNKLGYNVLNHGDFHFKNTMYKFDGDDLKDVLFVDYQLSVWATPALDLIYLLYAVASTETREKYRDELIYHYHQEFMATLKALGTRSTVPVPSLLDIHLELLKHGCFEIFATIIFLLYAYIDFSHNEIVQMVVNIPETQEEQQKIYSLPAYREVIIKTLPVFLHKGFL